MNGSSEDVVRFFCLGVRVHLPGFREITPPSARYTINRPVAGGGAGRAQAPPQKFSDLN